MAEIHRGYDELTDREVVIIAVYTILLLCIIAAFSVSNMHTDRLWMEAWEKEYEVAHGEQTQG